MRWSARCAVGAAALVFAFAALVEVATLASDPSAAALAAGANGWQRKKDNEKKEEVKPPEDLQLPIYVRLASELTLTDSQKRAFIQRAQTRTAALAQFDKQYGTQLRVMREELAKAEKSQNEGQITRLRPRIAALEQNRQKLIQLWHQKIMEAIPADQREEAEKRFTSGFGGGAEEQQAEEPKPKKGGGKKAEKKEAPPADEGGGDDAGGEG